MDEIHVLSPHRDDAMLTFGGFILASLEIGKPVCVHVLFGSDGNLDELFLSAIRRLRTAHPHWQLALKFAAKGPEGQRDRSRAALGRVLESTSSVVDQNLAGQLIRKSEERRVAALVGYELLEYPLLSAWPYRGYRRFDSPLRAPDARQQRLVLWGLGGTGVLSRAREVGFVADLPLSPIPELLARARRFPERQFLVLSPAGIGGHPDHIITAQVALALARERLSNLEVRVGEDLPYATLRSARARCQIPLRSLRRVPIDISAHLERKCALLQQYQSQLLPFEIGAIGSHHCRVATGLRGGLKARAIEIQYVISR